MSEGESLISARCASLRALGPRVEEAFRASLEHEDSPTYAQLEAKYQQLEDQYEALAKEIWATPVKSWQDVVERAELAYAYATEDPEDNQKIEDLGMRAAAELVMAVLQIVGGEGWRRTDLEQNEGEELR